LADQVCLEPAALVSMIRMVVGSIADNIADIEVVGNMPSADSKVGIAPDCSNQGNETVSLEDMMID
jgi:hypothetical protein